MGKNILLLDDDKPFCKLMVQVLAGRGHTIIPAASTVEADAALVNDNVDLIVAALPLADGTNVDWISNLKNPATRHLSCM